MTLGLLAFSYKVSVSVTSNLYIHMYKVLHHSVLHCFDTVPLDS